MSSPSVSSEERLQRLEQRVTLLEYENEALKRSWHAALEKLGEQTALEYTLQKQARELNAVRACDPALALALLGRENCDIYMQCCTSVESKRELWRLVTDVETRDIDIDVMLRVALFLYQTLNDTEFGELVMRDAFASSHFLRHWRKKKDEHEQYEALCFRYERWPEYVKSRFKRARAIRNRECRHFALKACLLMAQCHPSDAMDWVELSISDAMDASQRAPVPENYPQNVNATTAVLQSRSPLFVEEKSVSIYSAQ